PSSAKLSSIFCFVLSSSSKHEKSSIATLYTWAKRCDRFYFVTKLQNTSVDFMMLENFQNIDMLENETVERTFDVLPTISKDFSSYSWFLRATDETIVIMENLRKLVSRLDSYSSQLPIAYAGDVERMYKQHQMISNGAAILFNRQALNQMIIAFANEDNTQVEKCKYDSINDYELIQCLKMVAKIQFANDLGIVKDNLFLSQTILTYKLNEQLQVRISILP
ncbi:unnamed protein product, partial [Didymodactylos carnosus]